MAIDFYAVLDQVFALLRSRGRLTYNALQLQFHLDATDLAVLKEELLYAHPQVVDDAGRGLLWTGAPAAAPASAPSDAVPVLPDRKSTRLNSSHIQKSRMPSSA